MPSFLYFAYGSNMLAERLRAKERCPSARFVARAKADGVTLSFSKRSDDGSGKATLERRDVPPFSPVYGCLYELSAHDMDALDRVEGYPAHYKKFGAFTVTRWDTGAIVSAVTYIAQETRIDKTLKPYDWYLALVVAGAKQNQLPKAYIDQLARAVSRDDPDAGRRTFKAARAVLEAAGYPLA